MKCPKDQTEMKTELVNDVHLDVCPKCDGVWMDFGELQSISGNRVTEHELKYRGNTGRICQSCGKKVTEADLHAVVVDRCDCGIFFDRGEMHKIIGSYLKKPGRQIQLTERKLNKLREKGKVVVDDIEIVLI